MTRLDRFIQQYRVRMAARYIPGRARILDIGCADGSLFRLLKHIRGGVGVDPDISGHVRLANADLYGGYFPAALPDQSRFDVITMLAVMEHLQRAEQADLARHCLEYLNPGGKLVVTVPSPFVDRILEVLARCRLVDGMHIEQHYGFDVSQTVEIFESAGFKKELLKKFQFGLNNLFVFIKPTDIP